MLVVSRKNNESIVIGEEIRITVVQLRGDKVRLGVDAPANIPVYREEIYREIQSPKASDGKRESRRQSLKEKLEELERKLWEDCRRVDKLVEQLSEAERRGRSCEISTGEVAYIVNGVLSKLLDSTRQVKIGGS